jgi:hypothetical protein
MAQPVADIGPLSIFVLLSLLFVGVPLATGRVTAVNRPGPAYATRRDTPVIYWLFMAGRAVLLAVVGVMAARAAGISGI